MIWNNLHQQPSKENMKTGVKIKETHLTTKKNGVLQKFPARQELEEDEGFEEEKNWEGRRNFRSLSLLLSSYWLI